MTDDLEERQARRAAILQHSAELMQRTEEMLAEPRPVMTYEPPRQIRTHDAERIEHELNRRLNAIVVGLNERMDAIESNLASLRDGVEGLAEEAGGAVGQVEKRLREEIKREADALRGEVTLLRAQANTPARRQKSATARAPFRLNDDVSLTN